MTTLGPVERGLLVLYHRTTTDLDAGQLAQFLEPDAVAEVTGASLDQTIEDLRVALDLDLRRDRFAAALAYVLAVRADDGSADEALNLLGGDLLGRFSDVTDPLGQEAHLRSVVGRLGVTPLVDQDVADSLTSAFDPVVQVTLDGSGSYEVQGPGAEQAMMLLEIASMETHCNAREGEVVVNGVAQPVTLIDYEICHNAPFDRCKPGVDPRNWPLYNPSFFRRVDVVQGSPGASGSWAGIVQEQVGVLGTSPITTNLTVTYLEGPGMALTAYDLTPASTPNVPPDDGQVLVDHGVVALVDEGSHVRFRAVKVVALAKAGAVAPSWWLCPLWAHQVVLSGWWSWAP